MKYIILALLLIGSYYPFSFVKYNWKKKNKKASIGVMLLIIAAILLPGVLLFTR